MNNLEKNINRKEILQELFKRIPKDYQSSRLMFFEDCNGIRLGNRLYFYHITKNNEVVFTERKKRNGEIYDVLLTGNTLDKEKKIKSKKGKMLTGKKILFVCAGILLLSVYQNSKANEKETFQVEETLEDKQNVNVETKKEEIIIENNIELPKQNIVSVEIEVTPTDYLGFKKRQRTEEKYGSITKYYANRRGLDEKLVLNLFTRERYNDYDKVKEQTLEDIGYQIFDKNTVNVEEKMKENIGQLTRAICGEEIIAPVFLNGKVVGQDKLFVLPPCYDSYEINDLEVMCEKEEFTEQERNILKRAVELKKKGDWHILKRKDAFYNTEENINVATAYLSYIINKKQDLIRGVMSYNAGYGSVPNDLDYESIFNGSVEAFDPYYIPKILQYATFKDGIYECTMQFQNGETITYQFHNTLKLEETYEKETGYHL